MADSTNKIVLFGALAAGAYFLLKPKNSAAATTEAWAAQAATTPTSSTTPTKAAIEAAVAASTGAGVPTPTLPDGVAELAARAGINVLSMLAFLKWDAIINRHPDDLSTRFFLNNPETWAQFPGGYQRYKDEGIPQLAQQAGLDEYTVLEAVFLDAKEYGHPEWLSTGVFVKDQQAWVNLLAKYRAQKGLRGLAYAGPRPQVLG